MWFDAVPRSARVRLTTNGDGPRAQEGKSETPPIRGFRRPGGRSSPTSGRLVGNLVSLFVRSGALWDWVLSCVIGVEVLEVDIVLEAGFEAGEEVGPA